MGEGPMKQSTGNMSSGGNAEKGLCEEGEMGLLTNTVMYRLILNLKQRKRDLRK